MNIIQSLTLIILVIVIISERLENSSKAFLMVIRVIRSNYTNYWLLKSLYRI